MHNRPLNSKEGDRRAVTAYLAMGSNVGDARRNIEEGIKTIAETEGINVLASSALYRNAPVGGPDGQEDYINCVCQVRTTLSARALLQSCLAAERKLGRVRSVRWGPRTLDIDIALYGDATIREEGLSVPHPCLRERLFVLVPLSDVAGPELKLPPDGRLLKDILGEQLRSRGETSAQWSARVI